MKALGVNRLNEGPRSDSGTYPEIWEMIYASKLFEKEPPPPATRKRTRRVVNSDDE